MIKFELEEWQVRNLRNYFGENSKTQTAHWAYIVFDKALKEQCNIPDVVGRSEQLPESEKLCIMNQNFVCNCIDNSKCPNF